MRDKDTICDLTCIEAELRGMKDFLRNRHPDMSELIFALGDTADKIKTIYEYLHPMA